MIDSILKKITLAKIKLLTNDTITHKLIKNI